MTTVISP